MCELEIWYPMVYIRQIYVMIERLEMQLFVCKEQSEKITEY